MPEITSNIAQENEETIQERREFIYDSLTRARFRAPSKEHNLIPFADIVDAVPHLYEIGETDAARLDTFRTIFALPYGATCAALGDERTRPLAENPLVSPYHNLILPWPERLVEIYGRETYLARIENGEFDDMVFESGNNGLIPPGQGEYEGYLGLGSSTGEAPSLRQYYNGLLMFRRMRELVYNVQTWEEARLGLHEIVAEQNEEIAQIYGLKETDVIVRTASGTEAELLLSLWGVTASMFANETGKATGKALSGEHPSTRNWMGKSGLSGKIEGMENVQRAKEINLRDKGRVKDAAEIHDEVDAWLQTFVDQYGNFNSRVSLHITAGAKTGIGWHRTGGGLTVDDALLLRQKYERMGKGKIIIVADASQDRIDPSEVQKLMLYGILVNVTPSKFAGAPMFGHAMIVPEKSAHMARDWVKEHGVARGLKDYLVKDDVRELLDDRYLGELPDIPSIGSALKWAAALLTMREYRALRADYTHDPLDTLTRQFVVTLWSAFAAREKKKGKNGWSIRQIAGRQSWQYSPDFDALIPVSIAQNGTRFDELKMKKYHATLSRSLHLGQTVIINDETKESVCRITPSMEMLLRFAWEQKRGTGSSYIRGLCSRIANDMGQVLESSLF